MAGRGIGRGRGRRLQEAAEALPGGLAGSKTGDSGSATSVNGDSAGGPSLSLRDMQSIIEDSRTYNPNNDVKKVLMCARHFVKTGDDIKTLASLLYNKVLSDYSIAQRGAEICNCLTGVDCDNVNFRNCLLSLVQGDYKAREELISSDPTRFRGFLTFLCEIFNIMRTNDEQIFKPLVNPIFDSFDLILGPLKEDEQDDLSTIDQVNEDICEVFVEELPRVAPLLGQHDADDRLRRLMNRVRTAIIHSRSSPRVRCSLLEVIESYSRGWEAADSETARFFCDMAVDIISGLALS